MPSNYDERAHLIDQIEKEINADLDDLDMRSEYQNVYVPTLRQLITSEHKLREVRMQLTRDHLFCLSIDELRALLSEAGFLDDKAAPDIAERFLKFYNPLSPNYARGRSGQARGVPITDEVRPAPYWRSIHRSPGATGTPSVDANSPLATNQPMHGDAAARTGAVSVATLAEPTRNAMQRALSSPLKGSEPDDRGGPSISTGDTAGANKKPPVSSADLKAWWERRIQDPAHIDATIRQDWDAAKADFPGKMVSRERVVALRGPRKRGPKRISG